MLVEIWGRRRGGGGASNLNPIAFRFKSWHFLVNTTFTNQMKVVTSISYVMCSTVSNIHSRLFIIKYQLID